MAACTKIAAFIGLMRVFYVALGGTRWDWAPMMWVVAILTMVVGSIVAITQTDVKRMLAYSSIAHAGFLLTAFVGLAQAGNGVLNGITSTQAVLFYLVTYGFPTIGAFAVVTLVRDAGGEATHLSRWAGLGKKSPLLAGIFAFFLLSFAGIPLTAGFTGKWAVFTAAWTGGALAAGRGRRTVQPGRRVLLRPRDRADVLLRPAGRRAGRGPARAGRPRPPSPSVSPPRWFSVWFPDRCSTWRPARVSSSVESDPAAGREPGIRVRRRGARSPGFVLGWRRSSRRCATRPSPRRRSSPRPRSTSWLPAASGSGRCWCCWRPSSGRRRAPPRWSKAAVVVELTHVATLHHDDVMDEAALRRGSSTANARWDNSVAILSGDWLFARASDLVADLGPEAVRIQARTFGRLVEGQIRETLGVGEGQDPLKHYLSVVADKTGSLIATSALFGARYAGALRGDPGVAARLRRGDRRRPSSSPTTSSTSPRSPASPARRPAPTCARASRPCRS